MYIHNSIDLSCTTWLCAEVKWQYTSMQFCCPWASWSLKNFKHVQQLLRRSHHHSRELAGVPIWSSPSWLHVPHTACCNPWETGCTGISFNQNLGEYLICMIGIWSILICEHSISVCLGGFGLGSEVHMHAHFPPWHLQCATPTIETAPAKRKSRAVLLSYLRLDRPHQFEKR